VSAMKRPTQDEALMSTAMVFEARSTCDRAHVGAVIAKDGRIISTGYNGAPAGTVHCRHVGGFAPSPLSLSRSTMPASIGCAIAIHAEANAIAYAARHGVSVEGSTVYTTVSPCHSCAQLMIAAGLVRVVYGRAYRDLSGVELLSDAGVTVERWIV
jgi:dCMP deaminase